MARNYHPSWDYRFNARALSGDVTAYGIEHRPSADGPPLYDLLEGGLAPRDIYQTPLSWYTGNPEWLGDVSSKIYATRGKPDAQVWVYRAGPTGELNPGDWIALSREYGHAHRDSIDPTTYKTCAFRVHARDVRWAGDDLMEWGYWGPPVTRPWGLCAKSKRYHGPKHRGLGAAPTRRDAHLAVTEADLEALEELLDGWAPLADAQALSARFGFVPHARVYEGDTYAWRLVTVPDPTSANEHPTEPGMFVLTGALNRVAVRDKSDDTVRFTTAEDILDDNNLDPADYLTLRDELEDFWTRPAPLYHATTEDHLDDILAEGLIPMAQSRGLRNRGVRPAVFTTLNRESAERGTYGDVVFEIDTGAMARDGYTPQVAQEPDVVEADGRNALAHALGVDDFVDEAENDPDTIIVFGPIPRKYLRRLA